MKDLKLFTAVVCLLAALLHVKADTLPYCDETFVKECWDRYKPTTNTTNYKDILFNSALTRSTCSKYAQYENCLDSKCNKTDTGVSLDKYTIHGYIEYLCDNLDEWDKYSTCAQSSGVRDSRTSCLQEKGVTSPGARPTAPPTTPPSGSTNGDTTSDSEKKELDYCQIQIIHGECAVEAMNECGSDAATFTAEFFDAGYNSIKDVYGCEKFEFLAFVNQWKWVIIGVGAGIVLLIVLIIIICCVRRQQAKSRQESYRKAGTEMS